MRVELSPGTPGGRWAVLRPVTGHDELALDAGAPGSGTALVDRLLVAAPGTPIGPGTVGSLSVAERDRLLAAVYAACYGDHVESAATCTACGEPFELTFSLDALLADRVPRPGDDVAGPDDEGYYRSRDGRFRVPTVGDVGAVAALAPTRAPRALLERCVAGAVDGREEELAAAMERLAPHLDVDLGTRCPACGDAQSVRFSMERFLVGALTAERRFLTREVHRLAAAYGWGLDDILRLSREDRRTLVRQVEAERRGEAR